MRHRFILTLTLTALVIGAGLTLAGRPFIVPRPPTPPPIYKPITPIPQLKPYTPLPPIKPWTPPVTIPQRTLPPPVAWANARNVTVKSMPELRLTWSSRYHPTDALTLLSKGTQASKLPALQHRQLVRQSLDQVALLAEGAREPWGLLGKLQPQPGGAPPLGKELVPVKARLEHQAVLEGVQIARQFEKPQGWSEAGARAQNWFQAASKTTAPPGEAFKTVQQHLKSVQELTVKAADMERIVTAVQGAGKSPQQIAEAMQRINRADLPQEVRVAADGLHGLVKLEGALTQRSKGAPNVEQLRQGLRDFELALKRLPEPQKDEGLVQRLQQEVAFKTFLDGHPEQARQLWPQEANPQHAAQVLRDMKNLAASQGEVTTTPARQGAEPGQLPPGLRPLLPEGAREGWRPPVQGKATDGLPPLEQAAQRGEQMRAVLVTRLHQERQTTTARLQPHLQALNVLHQDLLRREAEEGKQIQQIEARLAEPMQPRERILAWHLLRQGKSADDAVKALEDQHQEDDLEDALDQLQSYLANDEAARELRSQIAQGKSDPSRYPHAEAVRKLLREGRELGEILLLYRHLLRPELLQPGVNIQDAVRLDEVSRRLQPGPDGFELAQAQELLGHGEPSGAIVQKLRKQRLRQEVKYNLERVKSYLDRPLTDEEQKKVRADLEAKKDVAEVVAAMSAALPPERRTGVAGIKMAVYLDEINGELEPNLDGVEYLRARHLLQQGSRPAEVIVVIASQRADAFEKLVQQRLPTVVASIRWLDQWGNQIAPPANVRDDVLELLRSGMSATDVAALFNR